MSRIRKVECQKNYCRSTVFEYSSDDEGTPTWVCCNCFNVTKRQTRVSAKMKEINELFKDVIK